MSKPQDFKPDDPRINRKGRPKSGQTWKDILDETFGEEVEFKGDMVTYKKLVCQTIRKLSLKGNDRIIKLAMERMEGKPEQDINLNGQMDTNITINMIPSKEK